LHFTILDLDEAPFLIMVVPGEVTNLPFRRKERGEAVLFFGATKTKLLSLLVVPRVLLPPTVFLLLPRLPWSEAENLESRWP